MNSVADNTNKKVKRMIPLRYVLTPITIILIAIAGLILVAALAPKPAKKPAIIKAPLVDVLSIERQNLRFSIASQGSVVPRTQTNLVSEVSGQITSVHDKFNVGGFFKKGESYAVDRLGSFSDKPGLCYWSTYGWLHFFYTWL